MGVLRTFCNQSPEIKNVGDCSNDNCYLVIRLVHKNHRETTNFDESYFKRIKIIIFIYFLF